MEMVESNDRQPKPEASGAKKEELSQPVYRAEDLFQGENEIIIKYGDAQYRLRITRAGKLILNK